MAAQTYYPPFIPAFSSNGAPVPGALLNFYVSGTTMRTPVYADEAMTVELPNPVSADAAGKYPAIYLDEDVTYRVVQTDATGVQLGDAMDPYVPGQALKGEPGDPGPAGNVAATLDQLKAAPTTNRTMIAAYDGSGSPMTWTPGNFAAQAADRPQDYVQANGIPLTTGAWVRQGADSVRVAGVVTLAAQTRFDELEVYVQAKPTNTPAQNLAALKAAIAYARTGGTVVFPDAGGLIDCSGASPSAVIDKPLFFRLDGRAEMSGNAQPMLLVTADGVRIGGGGTLAGDGSTNDLNINPATGKSYTIDEMPCMVRVEGADDFRVSSVTIDTPHKTAFALKNCTNADLRNMTWLGGIVRYSDTSYFGVVSSGGTGLRMRNHKLLRNAVGGRFVNFVFNSGLYGPTTGCAFEGFSGEVWEKPLYLFGPGPSHLAHNIKVAGVMTDVIRLVECHGADVRDVDAGDNAAGLVTIFDSTDVTLENLAARGLRQTAVYGRRQRSDYIGGLSRLKVRKLVVTGNPTRATFTASISGDVMTVTAVASGRLVEGQFLDGLATGSRIVGYKTGSGGVGEYYVKPAQTVASQTIVTTAEMIGAVTVLAQGADTFDVEIDGYDISNFAPDAGQGMIELIGQTPNAIRRPRVGAGNLASTSQRAIVLNRVTDGNFSNVKVRSAGVSAAQEIGCARNHFADFDCEAAGTGIEDLSSSSSTSKNKFSRSPTRGFFFLTAGSADTTVAGAFAPEAYPSIRPVNDAAINWIANNRDLRVEIVGGNLKVTTITGNMPTGAERFQYNVDN